MSIDKGAERTMREEGWILSAELVESDRPEPPEVSAFRLLQEEDWMHFIDNLTDNSALMFYNDELRRFDSAKNWVTLADQEMAYGPYSDTWEIPEDLSPHVADFCRVVRHMATSGNAHTAEYYRELRQVEEDQVFVAAFKKGGKVSPTCVLRIRTGLRCLRHLFPAHINSVDEVYTILHQYGFVYTPRLGGNIVDIYEV